MGAARAATVALLLGFSMMALELTAVRLLAPHFGDSAYVWTNVIGVMLVALAAGAWLGGMWAGGSRAPARLSTALVVAALAAALVPVLAGPLAGLLVPPDVPLEAAMGALVRGSLVATLLLFAPPVLLLGCAGPMLVAALVEAGVRVGRASGLVNASATVGSLLGTFLATHLLLPTLGSRASVWSCAVVVGVSAALVRGRWREALAAVPALLLAGAVRGPLRPPRPGQDLLAERETAYQFLQVLRETQGGGTTTRLAINEGLDSFHSLAIAGTAWTNGAYYDWHAVAPILAADGRVPAGSDLRVLSLGAAAGTFARVFAAAYPGCLVDGVEIDPEVVALGERYFGGRHAEGRDYALDARVFVERAGAASYDVVLVDTYARQIYVPAHVASVEFFAAAKRCLRPGGVLSVNAGGWSFDDPVVGALAATMRSAFGEVRALAVPWSRNFVLMARKDRALEPAVLASARTDVPEFAKVLAHAAKAEVWQRLAPERPVLTDDRPVLDTLQHEALQRARGAETVPRLTVMAGDRDPDEVGEAARALLLEGNDAAVLEAVARAREPTPYLRLLAGDARWARHDVAGAEAEFRAALAAGPAPELRDLLAARARQTGEFLASLGRGAAAATRNGVWAWVTAAAFAGVLVVLLRRARVVGRA